MGCEQVLGVLRRSGRRSWTRPLLAGGGSGGGVGGRRGGDALRGRLSVVLRLLRDVRRHDGGGRPDERCEAEERYEDGDGYGLSSRSLPMFGILRRESEKQRPAASGNHAAPDAGFPQTSLRGRADMLTGLERVNWSWTRGAWQDGMGRQGGHRALAEPSRARILETLAAAGEPLDAAKLAERVGLHPNTVRWHLGVLADAGFVTSSPEPPTRPGRPQVSVPRPPNRRPRGARTTGSSPRSSPARCRARRRAPRRPSRPASPGAASWWSGPSRSPG